jgi:uncharacterized membrane protein
MKSNAKKIAMTAIIAAMYAALTYAQGALLPGTTTAAIQFRASEALNVLALFTPYAIPGLTLGCFIANLQSIGQGLPLDMIFGTLATLGTALCMWALRNAKIKSYPLWAMLMPAIWNAVLVGAQIALFVDGVFDLSNFSLPLLLTVGGEVALGELGVMLVLGTALYYAITKRKLDKKMF